MLVDRFRTVHSSVCMSLPAPLFTDCVVHPRRVVSVPSLHRVFCGQSQDIFLLLSGFTPGWMRTPGLPASNAGTLSGRGSRSGGGCVACAEGVSGRGAHSNHTLWRHARGLRSRASGGRVSVGVPCRALVCPQPVPVQRVPLLASIFPRHLAISHQPRGSQPSDPVADLLRVAAEPSRPCPPPPTPPGIIPPPPYVHILSLAAAVLASRAFFGFR